MSNDALKSMLNNLINDNQAEASLDFHQYITGKMKEVSGLASAEDLESEVDDTTTEE